MSILIKGMEMPENCQKCIFLTWCAECEGYEDFCILSPDAPKYEWNEYAPAVRPDWCPLVELPPHRRLIDADEFFELLDGGYDLNFDEVPETKRELLRMITDAPTIIEAEVEE